jgi:GT2 family glycosyltransferase
MTDKTSEKKQRSDPNGLKPNIAAIVPVHNRREKTLNCLSQLRVCLKGYKYQFIVIDDGSNDGTEIAVRESFPDSILLKGDGTLWWTGAVEIGRRYSIERDFTHLLFVNDDVEFDKQFFRSLLRVNEDDPSCLVGAIKIDVRDHRGVLVSGYRVRGRCMQFFDSLAGMDVERLGEDVFEVDALAGAALLIPADVARKIGAFNLKDFPQNWGDMEYSFRAKRLGYSCFVSAGSRIYTEPNYRYLPSYITESSRIDFVRNLFDRHKYNYGFVCTLKRAIMHKNFFDRVYCFCRSYLILFWRIVYKLIIWNSSFDRRLRSFRPR